MRKNTCGTNDKHGCPPAPASPKAKTINESCIAEIVTGTTTGIKVRDRLAQVNVTVNAEADFWMPRPATEIKVMRKNVYLTQCQLVPLPNLADPPNTISSNLYLSGYVHKNLIYTDGTGIARDFGVNVPFHCAVNLDLAPDVFLSNKNALGENQFIQLAKNEMGADRCVTGGTTIEFFNEPFECELDQAETFEIDYLQDFDVFGRFRKVHEKMTINMLITITQLRIITSL